MPTNTKIEPFLITHCLEFFVFMLLSNHMDNRDMIVYIQGIGSRHNFLTADHHFSNLNVVHTKRHSYWENGSLGHCPGTDLDHLLLLFIYTKSTGGKSTRQI